MTEIHTGTRMCMNASTYALTHTHTHEHSDLNPTHAPIWTVSLQMVDTPNCLLAEQLLNFLNICYKNESMTQLLGDNPDDDVIGN